MQDLNIEKELRDLRMLAAEVLKKVSRLEKKLAPVEGPASKPKKADPLDAIIARRRMKRQFKSNSI